MEGGVIQGIFSDDPNQIGKGVFIADADVEGSEEGVVLNNTEWHVNVDTISPLKDTETNTFAHDCHEYVKTNIVETLVML
jgi:hypothetical protein